MTSQTGQPIITIRILPNVSRNKGYQAMKFGQLIEYSIINIFFEKLYVVVQNVVEKLVPEPFIKHRMSISESTVRKVIKFVFIVCPS